MELDANIVVSESESELELLTLSFSRLYINNNGWKKKEEDKCSKLKEKMSLLDHLSCITPDPANVLPGKCENLLLEMCCTLPLGKCEMLQVSGSAGIIQEENKLCFLMYISTGALEFPLEWLEFLMVPQLVLSPEMLGLPLLFKILTLLSGFLSMGSVYYS